MTLPKHLQARKSPVQDRAQQTVIDILDAAAHILAKNDDEGFSTNAIAERAGVSVGSLYQYFPHKTAIVAAVLERHSEMEAEHFRSGMARLAGKSLRHKVRGLLSLPLSFRQKHQGLQAALLNRMPEVGHHSSLQQRVRQAAQPLRALLEEHRQEIAREDLDLACHVLVNSLQSLTHHGVLPRPPNLTNEQLLLELEHLVMGYLGDSAPRRVELLELEGPGTGP